MPQPVLRGSSAPQLQYWEIDWSLTQGAKLSKEYKGIDIAKMSALANSLAATHSGKIRYEKNMATLTLETTNPSGSNPTGITTTLDRQRAVYAVCVQYDIIIIEVSLFQCF